MVEEVKRMNYPPTEILGEKKDFEYVILWMLNNNDYCRWKEFFNKPLDIKQSTLSNKLRFLIEKSYVEKTHIEIENKQKKVYRITKEGIKRYNRLSTNYEHDKKHLSIPPKGIRDQRDFIDIILWILYNNEFLQWKDFIEDPLEINPSTLSKKLIYLINKSFITKTRPPDFKYDIYKITSEGKSEYSRILKKYDLDRQSILEEEVRRIQEVTKSTIKFLEEYNIKDDNIKFRFLSNILKFDYNLVENIRINEDEFRKILLFVSINHPSEFPNFISLDEFSEFYNIKKINLEFFVDQIVNEGLFQIKFFKIQVEPYKTYYFQVNEYLEKILRVIVENAITKLTYLNQLYKFKYEEIKPITKVEIENSILTQICDHIVNKKLVDSMRDFLWEYINYLKYNIKLKKELKNIYEKLEGVVWQSIPEIYSNQKYISELETEDLTHKIKLIDTPNENDSGIISYYTKVGILRSKTFKAEFFNRSNFSLINKITRKLYKKEYQEAREFLEENTKNFDQDELLILKAIVFSYLKDYELVIQLSKDLIEQKLDSYVGYLIQSKIYEDMESYDEALKSIEMALKNSNNTILISQKTQILGKLEKFELALEYINDNLAKNPKSVPLLLSKSLILQKQEIFDLSLQTLNEALDINPNDYDLLMHKGIILNNINKYDEAINIFNQIIEKKPPFISYGRAYANLAFSYLYLRKYNEALEVVEKSIKLEPKRLNSYLLKVELLIITKRNKEAAEIIDKAIELDPKNDITYYIKARNLAQMKKYNSSLRIINKALRLNPKFIGSYEVKAKILRDMKKYKEALNIINKALEIEPEHVCLYNIQAKIFMKMKNFEEALNLIEKGIEIDPKNSEIYITKAYIFKRMNRYDEALKSINIAIELDPEEPVFYSNKAITLINIKKYEEALEAIEKSIELDPEEPVFYSNKAMTLNDMKKHEDALETIEKSIELDPENPGFYANKAHILGDKNKYKEALEIVEKSIALDPENPGFYSNKAGYLINMKKYKEALETIEKSIELDPEDPGFYSNKAQILREMHKIEEALEEIDKSIELDPEYPSSYNKKSLILRKMKKYKEALETIEKSIELDPEDPGFYSNKALILNDMKKHEDALDTIKNCIELDPDDLGYHINKAYILRDMKRYEEALETISKSIELGPDDPELYSNKALTLREMKRYEDALETIEKSIELDPEDPGFYSNKALILNDMKKHEDALDTIKNSIELDPEEPGFYINKAHILSDMKRYEEALEVIEKGNELAPNASNILNNKANILSKLHKNNEALKIISNLIILEPNEGAYLDTYGEVLMRAKNYKDAIKMFVKAINLEPDGFFVHESYINIGKCYFKIGNFEEALENLEKGKKLSEERKEEEVVEKAIKLILEIKKKRKEN